MSVNASAFKLKGNIKLGDGWHPEVYLASINNPEDLFVSSPDFLLASALVDADGSFEISHIELPNEQRFYRLYVVKNLFSPNDIINSDNRGLMHLVLDNSSQVEASATIVEGSFIDVAISGSGLSSENQAFDSQLNARLAQLPGNFTKTQKEFMKLGVDNYIRTYVDSCKNALNGLYALYHIEEKETDFLRNSSFYFNFQKKLHEQYPGHLYTQKYDELLESLVGYREMVCEMPGVAPKWKDYLILVEGGIILMLLLLLFVNSVKKKNRKLADRQVPPKELLGQLTNKELEILKLVAEAKSNKEIAAHLFIELSTVKTHLNSIYKQLKVENRKEAAQFYLDLVGKTGD